MPQATRRHTWPVFHEKIAEAAKLLDEMPASAKSEAPWYEARLELARDQFMDRDQAKAMLREALEKHPRYMSLYFIGADFHSPQWGGSRAELKACIDDVAKKTSSRAGDTMYARMQWSEQRRDVFQSGQADWPRMKRGFEKVLADYPVPGT